MKNLNPKPLATLLTVSLLGACSGGNSDGDKGISLPGDANNAQVIAEDVFYDAITRSDGTWRIVGSGSVSYDAEANDLYKVEGDVEISTLIAFDKISNTEGYAYSCAEEEPTYYNETTGLPNDDEDETFTCGDGNEERITYSKFSDSHYRFELSCNNEIQIAYDYIKVNNHNRLDYGSLTLSSPQRSGLNSNTACADIGNSDLTITTTNLNSETTSRTVDSGSLVMAAPYGDHKIFVEISLKNGIAPGLYEISEAESNSESNDFVFDIDISSLDFEGAVEDIPETLSAKYGSVSIDTYNFDDHTVSGSFDITTYEDENIQATFNFRLD